MISAKEEVFLRCPFAISPFNSTFSPPVLEETAFHDTGDEKILNNGYEVCKLRDAGLGLLISGCLALPFKKVALLRATEGQRRIA
jgi:hypothetical protein